MILDQAVGGKRDLAGRIVNHIILRFSALQANAVQINGFRTWNNQNKRLICIALKSVGPLHTISALNVLHLKQSSGGCRGNLYRAAYPLH